jgi:hypothetical protein
MLLFLVVPEVARFFYREADEIEWSRCLQSVVKRWPREGLMRDNPLSLDTSAPVTTPDCINIYRAMAFLCYSGTKTWIDDLILK